MLCPRCNLNARRNGKTSSGTQRYRCDVCKISVTGTKIGRPPIDNPTKNTIKSRKFRKKNQ